jgi:superfamily II DNA helicase RecQ
MRVSPDEIWQYHVRPRSLVTTLQTSTPSPLALLRRVFGHEDFHGAQREIIEHLVAGGDALVLMPTGGGKSLCYQLPALLRPGTAIVVSPLIALMQDQVAALEQLGVRAAFLNSTRRSTRPPRAPWNATSSPASSTCYTWRPNV